MLCSADRGWTAVCCLVFLTFCCPSLRGDLIVEVQDASVNPGGTSFVDVYVSSSEVLGDALNDYIFSLTISGPTSDGKLEFSDDPDQPSMAGVADYVFSGAPLYFASRDLSDSRKLTVSGSSSASPPGSDVTVFGAKLLLARLRVEHTVVTTAGLTLGQRYQISVDSGAAFSHGATFDPVTAGTFDGFVTVTPEPSCVAVMVAFTGAFVFRRWRGRRLISRQSLLS